MTTSIWVLMVKRKDGIIYPDMHKVPDREFFLTEEDALAHWYEQSPEMRKFWHIVELRVDVP